MLMFSLNLRTMSLRTVETANQLEIELGSSGVVLFSQPHPTLIPLPSSFLFSLPLTTDTPQSLQTPHSSLSHHLTVTLHPLDSHLPLVSKTTVYTRRYSSHTLTLLVHPETRNLDEPTRVEVEVPRTTFKAGESIPVYVTIPPPPRELVVDQGLRLRNVRTELVRLIRVKDQIGDEDLAEFRPVDISSNQNEDGSLQNDRVLINDDTSALEVLGPLEERSQSSSSHITSPISAYFSGSSYKTVIARSGASCRFHSSRPVQLRFVLHQPLPSSSPTNFSAAQPNGEYGHTGSDAECAAITQVTVLHSISFWLNINISFVDTFTHRERISNISIPLTILAPAAPLPEVSQATDEAYHKKHDRPPAKTVRHDEFDHAIPHYSEGEAGPSMLSNGGAPPPFEDRDAPPPFFFSEAEASTSTRLPTFLESESEFIIPSDAEGHSLTGSAPASIPGEGVEFGFLPSQQFDGHSEDMQRSSTPPPTLEMATRDTDLTSLADIHGPGHTMEALGLSLEHHTETEAGERPPPPPAMDDPSDPPPLIDTAFRSPDVTRQTSPSPPGHSSYVSIEHSTMITSPSSTPRTSQPSAPPPYLVPENHNDQENVARPPPYMD
jgi:neural Wiskott-Aldrich syndrome protein